VMREMTLKLTRMSSGPAQRDLMVLVNSIRVLHVAWRAQRICGELFHPYEGQFLYPLSYRSFSPLLARQWYASSLLLAPLPLPVPHHIPCCLVKVLLEAASTSRIW
jgi:hypothetical protein